MNDVVFCVLLAGVWVDLGGWAPHLAARASGAPDEQRHEASPLGRQRGPVPEQAPGLAALHRLARGYGRGSGRVCSRHRHPQAGQGAADQAKSGAAGDGAREAHLRGAEMRPGAEDAQLQAAGETPPAPETSSGPVNARHCTNFEGMSTPTSRWRPIPEYSWAQEMNRFAAMDMYNAAQTIVVTMRKFSLTLCLPSHQPSCLSLDTRIRQGTHPASASSSVTPRAIIALTRNAAITRRAVAARRAAAIAHAASRACRWRLTVCSHASQAESCASRGGQVVRVTQVSGMWCAPAPSCLHSRLNWIT